jgi:hypothetical protein
LEVSRSLSSIVPSISQVVVAGTELGSNVCCHPTSSWKSTGALLQ